MSGDLFQTKQICSFHDEAGRSVELFYRRAAGNGVHVLFLHGLAGSGEAFRSAPDRLNTMDHDLLIPDLPGHGRSDHDDSYPYTPSWYTRTLRKFLSTLGVTPDLVIGHSMGGTIGLFLGEQMKSRPFFISVEGIPESLDFLSRRIERYGERGAEGYRAMLEELKHAADPGIQAWLDWARSTQPIAFFESARSFANQWDGRKMLSRFRSYPEDRRFYICGDQGQGDYLRRELTDGEYDVIPDSGHFPFVNNPDAFWGSVRSVLERNV